MRLEQQNDSSLSLWERTRVRVCCLAFGLTCALALLTQLSSRAADPIPPGKSDFLFTDDRGNADKPIRVWLFRPDNFQPTSPVVFVMHGTLRNGETYREPWIALAEPAGALVVVPEFSREHYGDSSTYQFGNMLTESGEPIDESKWTFAAIEHLFDHLKVLTGSHRDNYFMFGHSAGAQFVHRMVLFQPNNRIALAVTANSGSYTFPDFEIKFPYGLQDSPLTESRLKSSLHVPMLVLLGENDTDPNDEYLPKSPEAMAQGPMRLARGHSFYRSAQAAADHLSVPLKWTKVIVPNVGHDNALMAPFAARAMFEAK
jgi:poly(3-hydroxybutyrate) depolymerase